MTKAWEEKYNILVRYYELNGNIDVPIYYSINGFALGRWLSRQRNEYSKGILKQEKIDLLNQLNISWNMNDVREKKRLEEWMRIYKLLENYYIENGNTNLPDDYYIEGINLSAWLANQRNAKKGIGTTTITKEKIDLLDKLNIVWDFTTFNQKKWFKVFEYIKSFYNKNNNLNVSINETYDGINLWNWMKTQRDLYKKNQLEAEKKKLLDSIGFSWNPLDDKWNNYYKIAKKFFDRFGHINIPDGFVIDGIQIGRWISVQRQAYKGRQDVQIDKTKINKLEVLNIDWNYKANAQTSFLEQTIYFYVKKIFDDAINRYVDLGFELDIFIPSINYAIEYDGSYWHKSKKSKENQKDLNCFEKGINLIRIRDKNLQQTNYAKNYFIDENDDSSFESVLKELFFNEFNVTLDINIERDSFDIFELFNDANDTWYVYYAECKDYYVKNGNLIVPKDFVTDSNLKLGKWIRNQRNSYNGKNTQLSNTKVKLLEDIGMIWSVNDYKWNNSYLVLCDYYRVYGNCDVPQSLVYKNMPLGKWVMEQRSKYKSGNLSNERIIELNNIEFKWSIDKNEWEEHFSIAKKYFLKHKNLDVKKNYIYENFKLGQWIGVQRSQYNKKKLKQAQIEKLESIGIVWDAKYNNWLEAISYCKKYIAMFGNLNVPSSYVIDGFKLGQWIGNVRNAYNGNAQYSLSSEKISELNDLGMIWNTNEFLWELGYSKAKEYYEEFGNVNVSRNFIYKDFNLGSWIKNQKDFLDGKPNSNFTQERIKKLNLIGIFSRKKID